MSNDTREVVLNMLNDEVNDHFTFSIIQEITYSDYAEYNRLRFAFSTQAAELLKTHDPLDPQACLDCQEGACDRVSHNSADGE